MIRNSLARLLSANWWVGITALITLVSLFVQLVLGWDHIYRKIFDDPISSEVCPFPEEMNEETRAYFAQLENRLATIRQLLLELIEIDNTDSNLQDIVSLQYRLSRVLAIDGMTIPNFLFKCSKATGNQNADRIAKEYVRLVEMFYKENVFTQDTALSIRNVTTKHQMHLKKLSDLVVEAMLMLGIEKNRVNLKGETGIRLAVLLLTGQRRSARHSGGPSGTTNA